MLESGEYASQTDLGRKVGVSRARVNQYLRLLKLPPEIQEEVIKMGDPLQFRKISERTLRAVLSSFGGGHFAIRNFTSRARHRPCGNGSRRWRG